MEPDERSSDAPGDDVPVARRGVPTFAPPAPPTHAVRRPARRAAPGRTARSLVVGAGSAVLVALAATVLVLGALTVVGPDERADTVSIELGPRPVAPAPDPVRAAVADPVIATPVAARRPAVRVRVRVTTAADRVRARLTSSTPGRVVWTLTGPRGRVVDRARLRVSEEPTVLRVTGLAPGTFRWQVAPVRGPSRAGRVAVAGAPPEPPILPAPDPTPTAPASTDAQDPPAKPTKPTKPRKPSKPDRRPPRPAAQPNPHQEVDPDDVPDPIDPSPRTRLSR